MLTIDPAHIAKIASATSPQDLYGPLQAAIELEHSTIPLYLTAEWSIKTNATGPMQEVLKIIQSVCLEEMLHMAIACNVLNAIGGSPQINTPNFIPTYPGFLPMVGDFQVHLAPLSLDQLNLFLKIEEPEHGEIPFRVAALEEAPRVSTIGEFYRSISNKLKDLGKSAFIGSQDRQVTSDHVGDFMGELSAITNVEEALNGLNVIVQQGEGTQQTPLEGLGKGLAHFYRFKQIVKGRKLISDPKTELKYSYSGDPISLDPNSIEDMISDPKASNWPADSDERKILDQFNSVYKDLLNNLHSVFNGAPADFNTGPMFKLRSAGRKVISTTDSHTGKKLTPSFEY